MRPEGRPLILHLLLHVGNFLVEGQVGVLQVLDLGDQGLDPGLGLGQLVGSIVVRTPEKTTNVVFTCLTASIFNTFLNTIYCYLPLFTFLWIIVFAGP